MSEIHVVTADATARIAAALDEQSILKDGYTIMALFELEQAVFFMPATNIGEEHLKSSTYGSFEWIIKKIYGNDKYAESYIADTKLFASLIKSSSMQ